ncbi:unnamed protein product, partial [Amoebophrya sp. A120]|eukprot:GSA120T00012191001.1
MAGGDPGQGLAAGHSGRFASCQLFTPPADAGRPWCGRPGYRLLEELGGELGQYSPAPLPPPLRVGPWRCRDHRGAFCREAARPAGRGALLWWRPVTQAAARQKVANQPTGPPGSKVANHPAIRQRRRLRAQRDAIKAGGGSEAAGARNG